MGRPVTDILKPRDGKDAEEAVRWALANDKALEVMGAGTKRGIGRPSQTDLTLDLSGLDGVTLYEPEELVLSAKAGTPMAEIEKLLDYNDQEFAFEPPDYGPLLGGEAGKATIGGVIAANLSGPRRLKAGAARDHFLGVHAVTGRGETIKSGGRVVKNVTGYDLCKVFAGSWGTLVAMIDVTLKVLPKAEIEASVVVHSLDDASAARAMAAATNSAFDVSAAAHLPDHIAGRFPELLKGEAATILRVEGFEPSVEHRKKALAALLKDYGAVALLDHADSRAVWRGLRDVTPFAAADVAHRPLWRVSTAPARGHEIVAQLTPAAQVYYDWGGGLVWIAMPFGDEPDAAAVRSAVAKCGGHATLIRAPAAVRATLDVFDRQDAGVAALSKRIKDGFDPRGVLNPGRMWAGV
jgi:glycolate oxidase FAD binding subunit